MALGAKEVEEVALLSRLRLRPEEVDRLAGELSAILGYVEQLQSVDTAGVEPMTHAVPMDCPLRIDRAGESLTTDEALGGAPRRAEGFFVVPRIIEGGK